MFGPSPVPTVSAAADGEEDEFELSETFQRPTIDPLKHDVRLSGPSQLTDAESETNKPAESVDALATASQLAEEVESESDDIEQLGYFRRTFGLFAQVETCFRWLLLTYLVAAMLWLSGRMFQSANASGGEQMFAILYIALIGAMLVPLTLGWSANMYAVVADTSSGSDRTENWPEDIFSDWIGNSLIMFVVGVVAGIPGSFLLSLFSLQTTHYYWPLFLFVPSFAVCFPVFLIGVLEGDGLNGIVSPPVLSSLLIAWRSWLQFMGESLILFAMLIPAVFLLLANSDRFLVLILLSAWCVFICFVYFRLLGVLGHRIEVSLNADSERLAAAEDELSERASPENESSE